MSTKTKLSAIRVCLLTTSYPLHPKATSGIFVKRLADALRKKVKVIVVTPDDNKTLLPPTDTIAFRYAPKKKQQLSHLEGGIPVALKKSKTNYIYMASLLINFFLASLRHGKNSDILHANWSIPGIIAGLVGLLIRKPAITTLRGEDVHRAHSSSLFKLSLYSCILLNKRIICVSTDMQESLHTLFPRKAKKILHIPNGVDTCFSKLAEPDKKTTDRLVLLCVGSLIKRKDFATVIKALPHCETRNNLLLCIAGAGPEHSNLAALAEALNVSTAVRFLGSVAPDAIYLEYQKADIFIIASRSEGRPNALIEAMSTGLPVIGTRISGITELIEDNISGCLFEPGEHMELAHLIDSLVRSQDMRNKVGKNARNSIERKCAGWETTAFEYFSIYTSLIQQASD